ncbi:hypothetical protein Fmac_025768 [Flemingia macrophylla]|uniref:Uncharacterized protein n=1 Tax=Flemingia macrophylla TaxID=520843 RepID=A0ABD1LT85_9FABA
MQLRSMLIIMTSFSPLFHLFTTTHSMHSKPHLNKNDLLFSLCQWNLAFSPLKAATKSDAETVVELLQVEDNSLGANEAATFKPQTRQVKVVGGFLDPRWVGGTWDLT